MKKILFLLALLGVVLFSSCVKDLSEVGIFDETICQGSVLIKETNQPLDGVSVATYLGSNKIHEVLTAIDGSFEIPIELAKRSEDYRIVVSAKRLFQEIEISLSDVPLGIERYDLGCILIEDAFIPKLTIDVPAEITTSSVFVCGRINQDGHAEIIERGFVYGTMMYPTLGNNSVQCQQTDADFSIVLDELTPNTQYYVRSYARNAQGIGYSVQVEFSTLSGLPVVETQDVSTITAISAQCGGRVSGDGGYTLVDRGVCWSLKHNPTIKNTHVTSLADTGIFEVQLRNLLPGRTYYVRAFAQNQNGVAYGQEVEFSTLDGLPAVTTDSLIQYNDNYVIVGGTVVDDGGFEVVARGVCYGTTPLPSITSKHTSDGSGLGSYVSHISGLSVGQTYYFRSYATNANGIVYGEQYTFVM